MACAAPRDARRHRTWEWDATVAIAQFNAGSTALPWDVNVGDVIHGTFTIDYADAGVSNYPNVRDYLNQPSALVTAVIEDVDVWLGTNADSTRTQMQDEPDYLDPNVEIMFIDRQVNADPRFSGHTVAGGMIFRDRTGSTFPNTDLPTTFDLNSFDVASFGLFVGGGPVVYDFEAHLTRVAEIPEPSAAIYACLGLVALIFRRKFCNA